MVSPSDGLAAPQPPPWVNLPHEITSMILQKLGLVEILLTARRVCTTWRNISKDPAMWRIIIIDHYDVLKLCRLAVDLSQGQLIEIEVQADNEMIDYIAQRSCKLKRLKFTGIFGIHSKALSEAVKKFPLLEEMHLAYLLVDDQFIIDMASSCPLLTSLTLYAQGWGYHSILEFNRLAFVVSCMPKLCHLRINRYNISNEGLIDILNGCSQLESLDLSGCRNFELDGKLVERCSQQIKDLRLPHHSHEEDYASYHEFYGYDDVVD